MDVKFTISEMAKFNGISRQTLIHYDKEGVFKPKIIDPSNGYRYYTSDQLEVLDSIITLKEIGLSLKEIKEHMDNRNAKTTLELLKTQQEGIINKINKLNIINERISKKIKVLENFEIDYKDNGKIIYLEKELLAIKKVSKPNDLVSVDIALKKLLKHATINNYDHFYQTGDIISNKNLKEKNYRKFTYVFLPLGTPCEDKNLLIKQEGYYACAYHKGNYENMNSTYEKLIEHIDDLGYKVIGDAYEYYIFDNLTTKTPNAYITEIQIQVGKK